VGARRSVRTLPLGPAARAAAILLLLSAILSLILGARLLASSGRFGVGSDEFGIALGRGLRVAFGVVAIVVAGTKLAAGIGVLARRPWAAVLGIVLAGLDAFFALPGLGAKRPLVAVELAVDAFVIWALARHLTAMPKEAEAGASWTDLPGRFGS